MNEQMLCDSIGAIDDVLIESTGLLRKSKKQSPTLLYSISGAAACVCIVLAAISILNNISQEPKSDPQLYSESITEAETEEDKSKSPPASGNESKSEQTPEDNQSNDVYLPAFITISLEVEQITENGFYGTVCDESLRDTYMAGTKLNVVLPQDDGTNSTIEKSYGLQVGDIVTISFSIEEKGTVYAEGGIEIEKKN